VDGDDDRHLARRDAVVGAQPQRLHPRPGGRYRLLGAAQFRGQRRSPLPEHRQPGLVAGDVGLQHRRRGVEALPRLVDGEHHAQFLLLEASDRLLRRRNLLSHRLVFVVLADRKLLGPVLRHLALRSSDLYL
jgi:hypothetical protein